MTPEPELRKAMVLGHDIGRFKNGPYEGVLDKKVIEQLVANYSFKTQVPVFLWDHVSNLDEREPDGWVEGVRLGRKGEVVCGETLKGGELVGDPVKLHGEAVRLVGSDRIRQLSPAWNPKGVDYQGNPIGAVLQHVTLTNNPYIKDIPNVAAARSQGGEPLLMVMTALPSTEAVMADEKDQEIARLRDENAALKAQSPDEATAAKLKETQALLQEQIRKVADLTASNENLRADVEKFKSPKSVTEMRDRMAQQDRQLKALQISAKVKRGVARGQFNRALVGDPDSGYDHESPEMVLSWFDEHEKFKGSMDRLDIMLDTMPRLSRREFGTGTPNEEVKEASLTAAQKNDLRLQGQDPDAVEVAMQSADSGSFIAQQKSKKAS